MAGNRISCQRDSIVRSIRFLDRHRHRHPRRYQHGKRWFDRRNILGSSGHWRNRFCHRKVPIPRLKLVLTTSLLFMLETQSGWYRIRPFRSLGWHVGFWNVVGSVGFTICGAFGIASAHEWAAFQSGCSTFWGSWAFLIGSICQWIECLNR